MLLDAGFLTVTVRYSLAKNGTCFYYRRIPDDLRGHYKGKRHFRKSLQTSQPHIAAKKIAAMAAAHDALWHSLRSPAATQLGLTTQQSRDAADALLTVLGLAAGDIHRPELHDHPAETLDAYFEGQYGRQAPSTSDTMNIGRTRTCWRFSILSSARPFVSSWRIPGSAVTSSAMRWR